VPTLFVKENRCVKIFILNMEQWFKPRDMLVKVEHVGVTSKLISWILNIGIDGEHKWIEEGEDHVDLCVYP
jgi:hypothetical protein